MDDALSDEQINLLVMQFLRQHFTRLHTLMDQIGLFRGQPPVLHQLWENEGINQTELAERLHLAPATVTKMVQRMELAGLIERRADPADQRITRVYLTAAGRDVQDAVRQRERQIGEEALAGFSQAEKSQLAGFLGRMRDNLLIQNSRETHEC